MAAWRVKTGVVFLAGVIGLVWPSASRAASAPHDKDQTQKPAAADQAPQADLQDAQALIHLADTAMSGQPAPSDFGIQFQNDFIRAQGTRVWVPMTLTIDPAKLTDPAGGPMALYVRVTPRGMTAPPPPPAATPSDKDSKDKKNKKDKGKDKEPAPEAVASQYPVEDVSFLQVHPAAPGQPIRITRGMGVPPGRYDLYVILKERAAGAAKTAVLKQPLDVPDYTSAFSTSSIIVAQETKPLTAPITAEQQSEHPYSFGTTEIVVSPDHRFRKSQELIVILQIYNQTMTADHQFNLEATYTFFKQGDGGEARFNATEPQVFTPGTPGFDPSAADRSIQAGQGIPLQSFPEGSYRLEIKVTDKSANPAKVLTQSVNFTVTS